MFIAIGISLAAGIGSSVANLLKVGNTKDQLNPKSQIIASLFFD
jgi:hypothetical protein